MSNFKISNATIVIITFTYCNSLPLYSFTQTLCQSRLR